MAHQLRRRHDRGVRARDDSFRIATCARAGKSSIHSPSPILLAASIERHDQLDQELRAFADRILIDAPRVALLQD